jgi:Arc/MetJ-type ribon-helix-helix transcriptional regulator
MKDSGLTQKQWILEVQKQKPAEKSSQNLLQNPIDGELVDELKLPSSAIIPIAGIDRLTQTRRDFQSNSENLQDKLTNIQQRLAEHQQQKSANDESFDLGLKSRRAALLAKVAEAAIEDKLTAEQLYDAIVSSQLDLTPKSQVGNG